MLCSTSTSTDAGGLQMRVKSMALSNTIESSELKPAPRVPKSPTVQGGIQKAQVLTILGSGCSLLDGLCLEDSKSA